MIEQQQLCELVLAEGLIDETGLEEALQVKAKHGGDLYSVLIENGFVDEEQTITSVAQLLNIPCVSLRDFEADPNIAELLPARLASKHRAVPLGSAERESGDQLFLAMANPIDVVAMEEIVNETGFDVVAFLAGPGDIEETIERVYGKRAFRRPNSLEALFDGGESEVADEEVGPSVSQLLELPIFTQEPFIRPGRMDAMARQEEDEDGHRPPAPARAHPVASVQATQMEAPPQLIGGKAPVLDSQDLESFLNGDVGMLDDEPPGELFGFSGSKIFMTPEALSDAGRQRLREARDDRPKNALASETRMGPFKALDSGPQSADALDPFSAEALGAGDTMLPGFVKMDDPLSFIAPSAAALSSAGDSKPVPFPRALTQRSIKVLHQAYSTSSIDEVLGAAGAKDLIVSLILALLERGVVSEDELLRALARRHVG
jgi:hypothetical protein